MEASLPSTTGVSLTHEAFVNQTLAREKKETMGGVTTTVTVSACTLRTVTTITAPFADRTFEIYSQEAKD